MILLCTEEKHYSCVMEDLILFGWSNVNVIVQDSVVQVCVSFPNLEYFFLRITVDQIFNLNIFFAYVSAADVVCSPCISGKAVHYVSLIEIQRGFLPKYFQVLFSSLRNNFWNKTPSWITYVHFKHHYCLSDYIRNI